MTDTDSLDEEITKMQAKIKSNDSEESNISDNIDDKVMEIEKKQLEEQYDEVEIEG